ncbi:MAG: twin-arginine translocation signal domain-containing protein [Planctomycetales bacterium]|nr:twin-arginine translocation signal domain-containing protein [Planctomycetales bacterium]
MKLHVKTIPSRRRFLKQAAAATALTTVSARTFAFANNETIVGTGEYRYRADHQWAKLPSEYSWQTTHNVAVDSQNNLYVIHEGHRTKQDHPSIFVFDPDGKFIRAFGSQFQGGGHGIEVHNENGTEYLYVCGYQQVKMLAKMDLMGNVVWQKFAPMKSGKYADGEAAMPKQVWGRDRFMPTNFAFLPDGDFLVADGYGSYFVHRYDRDGNWKSSFGGPGDGSGTFNTPHGIWYDDRPGRTPAVVVADRAHHTVQYLTVDGRYQETIEGFGLPANFDTFGDLLLVPELVARVTLLGKDNQVVAQLGDDTERIKADSRFAIRGDESAWQDGKFVHPHDACFDKEGNIFIAEWVGTGRITKLTRIS